MKKIDTLLSFLMVGIFAAAALGQSSREDAQARLLKEFDGKTVAIKLDMPATARGVEVDADKQNRVNPAKNQKRLKTYGTAIKSGESARVTNVRVSKDEISFELSGGGAPEGDLGSSAGQRPLPQAASTLESRTRARLNSNPDSLHHDAQQDRDSLKYQTAERKHNDVREQAAYEARRQKAIEIERARRLTMGSRFVIKFDRDTASVTPDELRRILADVITF